MHAAVAIIIVLFRGSDMATVVGVVLSVVDTVKLGSVVMNAGGGEAAAGDSLCWVLLLRSERSESGSGVGGAACSSHSEVALHFSFHAGVVGRGASCVKVG